MAAVGERLRAAVGRGGDGRGTGRRGNRSRTGGRTRSRGQLLLVGGLALAVSLLVLAVVLNSAIYTENLATRDRASAPGAAADLRWDVVDGVGGIVEYVNREHAGETYADLYGSRYDDAFGEWSPMLARHVAVRGASVDVAPVAGMQGTRVVDDDPGTAFVPRTNPSTVDALGGSYPEPNWLVASNVSLRGFVLDEVDRASLATASEGDPLGFGAFFVEVRDSADGDSWRVGVYRDSGTGDLSVTVYDVATATVVDTCTTGDSTATVDLAGETLAGEPCDALSVLGDVTGLASVLFVDGEEIVGTYELTVDRVGHGSDGPLTDAVDAANYGFHCDGPTYHDDPGSGSPSATAAIYAATAEMRYDDRSLSYESAVRVAPDEVGDAPSSPVVTELAVTDVSGGGDAAFEVGWTTADPDSDPGDVAVEAVLDPGSSATGPANGSETLTDAGGEGGTYEITLTASDDDGNDRRVTQTHVADGDDDATECPA